ncbi:RdgB/HAM1 family non-canonical purine NTP pyrophosphatase [Clavibacter michiganensis]|uniref:RdgB/HAM1 family non-canonical purine NTP pyrophosphatase n=1 Tax=Clavibacter michiganensis TaxID=28447 RepID=UPI001D0B1E84|nr:RdgB/HAM1 family non-canonical purine NTP pyrophosphatase [Clavibacter michiganensis]MDO4043496.1 RdgB/HAM1 family non-canonical purine NTP pyrophosphatase [Clavibacter michiganensis]MDO4052855.1 RdgB/HAM1 family non-canonical purine NTP pyrophosphatase [Clavibacter michiganensis]MDO4057477.1 RdgB/HAM1 family non-canonical purine NTP pyrophosphatase [Clavibacter michiganensis]MDO4064716.1 RdgB/HAM1 family non-canonical purine NTP pyrophosphatase [Clavibacter michiganensis]MDO4067785.1 RdgB/
MIALVLATHNAHKVEELRRILGTRLDGIDLVAYDGPEPVEDGTTFEENALIKARAAALHTGHAALADDSGISVDILGGSPGIFSARWAGPARDSRENLELLLWQLADVPDEHRGARFTCAAALVVPTADGLVERTALGAWEGSVLREVAGEGGFGYDPIFRPANGGASAAALSADEKNRVSHRALAFDAIMPVVRHELLGEA